MQFRVTFARAIGALDEPTADQHEVNSAAKTVCATASVGRFASVPRGLNGVSLHNHILVFRSLSALLDASLVPSHLDYDFTSHLGALAYSYEGMLLSFDCAFLFFQNERDSLFRSVCGETLVTARLDPTFDRHALQLLRPFCSLVAMTFQPCRLCACSSRSSTMPAARPDGSAFPLTALIAIYNPTVAALSSCMHA
jgi:hypothetical protein